MELTAFGAKRAFDGCGIIRYVIGAIDTTGSRSHNSRLAERADKHLTLLNVNIGFGGQRVCFLPSHDSSPRLKTHIE
jgi:hypothetical protein